MSEEYKFSDFDNIDEEQQYKILSSAMDEEKQNDFYKKLRSKIQGFIEKHPNSKYINYLVAAPDLFHLLCRLLADGRVPLKNKLYIAATILYFISPIDIIPDAIPGLGVVDDVIIAVNVINLLLKSVDKEVILEHWAGEADVFEQIQLLLDMADTVIGKKILSKIKKFFAR